MSETALQVLVVVLMGLNLCLWTVKRRFEKREREERKALKRSAERGEKVQ